LSQAHKWRKKKALMQKELKENYKPNTGMYDRYFRHLKEGKEKGWF